MNKDGADPATGSNHTASRWRTRLVMSREVSGYALGLSWLETILPGVVCGDHDRDMQIFVLVRFLDILYVCLRACSAHMKTCPL